MKKTLLKLTMLFTLMVGGDLPVNAAWRFKTSDPITKAEQLTDGMIIAIENRCCGAAAGKLWSAPNSYGPYEMLNKEHAFRVALLSEKNAITGEPMIKLQSVQNGCWWSGDNGFVAATASEAEVLTVGKASLYTDWQFNKADGWTEDNPQWQDFNRAPAWDFKTGGSDALTFAGGIESDDIDSWYFLGQVWGWPSYNYIWYSKARDVNAFYAYEVEEFEDLKNDLIRLVNKCEQENYVDVFVPGEGVGFYGVDEVKAFNEAFVKAKSVLKETAPEDDDLRTACQNLQKALDAALASVVEMHSGYFYLVSGHPGYFEFQGVYKAMYDNGERPCWKTLDKNDPIFLFKCTEQKDHSYVIQNMRTQRYLNGVSATSETVGYTQTFVKIGEGQYNIQDESGTYHTESHYGGKGEYGNIVAWSGLANTGSSWLLKEVTDKHFVDSLMNVIEQGKLNDRFVKTLNSLRDTYNAGFVEKWYISDVEQLSSNAEEPGEGSLAGLLDKDDKTYFHSTYSRTDVKEPHYLQVKLDEPVQKLSIYWKKRMDNNTDRPTKITLFGSNDGKEFINVATLPVAPDVFPTEAEDLEYHSSKSVDMGRPYEYVRFRVDATNSPERTCQGIEYFTFSEFNLSDEGFPLDSVKSLGIRTDMKEAYAALNKAIAEASLVDETMATEADIEKMEDAMSAFQTAYPDTAVLVDAIKDIEQFLSEAIIPEEGVEANFGECGDLSVYNDIRILIATLRANMKTNSQLTRAEINAQVEQLQEAKKKFIASVALPKMNQWYYIVNNSKDIAYEPQGKLVYPENHNIGAGLKWGGSVDEDGVENPDYIWQFLPTEKNGTFYVQNVGTGYYMSACQGTSQQFQLSEIPVAYRFEYVTGGQLALMPDSEDALPIHAAAGNIVVAWGAFCDNASIWNFVASSEEQGALTSIKENTIDIYCLPYDVYSSFYAYDETSGKEATVDAFQVCGGKCQDSDVMNEIGLVKIPAEQLIPAGTPFIIVCGNNTAKQGKELTLDLGIVPGSVISTEAKETVGLVGVFKSTEINKPSFAYFDNNNLIAVKEGEKATIAAQRGYIDAMSITSDFENADMVLKLENGVVSGVESVVAGSGHVVSVYTADGQLIRKNVTVKEAMNGLNKGIYIVNGKKVLVR